MNNKLRTVLDANIWTTAGIISGHDKGGTEARKKSIDNTMEVIQAQFVVVSKDAIDILLETIGDYVITKMNPQLGPSEKPNTISTPVVPATAPAPTTNIPPPTGGMLSP